MRPYASSFGRAQDEVARLYACPRVFLFELLLLSTCALHLDHSMKIAHAHLAEWEQARGERLWCRRRGRAVREVARRLRCLRRAFGCRALEEAFCVEHGIESRAQQERCGDTIRRDPARGRCDDSMNCRREVRASEHLRSNVCVLARQVAPRRSRLTCINSPTKTTMSRFGSAPISGRTHPSGALGDSISSAATAAAGDTVMRVVSVCAPNATTVSLSGEAGSPVEGTPAAPAVSPAVATGRGLGYLHSLIAADETCGDAAPSASRTREPPPSPL